MCIYQMFHFCLLAIAAASVHQLPQLINSVKGMRVINRGGREMPRALYEATEAHRKVMDILYSATETGSGRFNEIIAFMNNIPEDTLTRSQSAIIREYAHESSLARSDVRRAIGEALIAHSKLANLFSFHFAAGRHLQRLDDNEMKITSSLERMLTAFTVDNCSKYGQSVSKASVDIQDGLSTDLYAVRDAFVEWYHPRIKHWSTERKLNAARVAFDQCTPLTALSNTDLIQSSECIISLAEAYLATISSGSVVDTRSKRNEVVRLVSKRQLSSFFWTLHAAELRMIFKSLQIGWTKTQSKRWDAVIHAERAFAGAEKQLLTYGSLNLDKPPSVEEAEKLLEDVKRTGRMAGTIIATRKTQHQRIRQFLESF